MRLERSASEPILSSKAVRILCGQSQQPLSEREIYIAHDQETSSHLRG